MQPKTYFTYLGRSYRVVTISKKILKTLIFELYRLCSGPFTKRPVIHPPQTITAAGQSDPGRWDLSTSVAVKPGPRPAPATHQAVRPQGLRTMPDPPAPPGGPEYPQGILGPYPQHHPHHYQRHHH